MVPALAYPLAVRASDAIAEFVLILRATMRFLASGIPLGVGQGVPNGQMVLLFPKSRTLPIQRGTSQAFTSRHMASIRASTPYSLGKAAKNPSKLRIESCLSHISLKRALFFSIFA